MAKVVGGVSVGAGVGIDVYTTIAETETKAKFNIADALKMLGLKLPIGFRKRINNVQNIGFYRIGCICFDSLGNTYISSFNVFLHPKEIIIFILSLYLFVSAIVSLIYRNAFVMVQMDTEWIRNKNVCLRWDEINHIEVCSIELFKYSLLPTKQIDILMLSSIKKHNSFMKTNKRCVYLSFVI